MFEMLFEMVRARKGGTADAGKHGGPVPGIEIRGRESDFRIHVSGTDRPYETCRSLQLGSDFNLTD